MLKETEMADTARYKPEPAGAASSASPPAAAPERRHKKQRSVKKQHSTAPRLLTRRSAQSIHVAQPRASVEEREKLAGSSSASSIMEGRQGVHMTVKVVPLLMVLMYSCLLLGDYPMIQVPCFALCFTMQFCALVIYSRLYLTNRNRILTLARSILVSQLVVLFLLNCIISLAYADASSETWSGGIMLVLGQMALLMALAAALIVDVCESTVLEGRICLISLALICLGQILGNLFLFADVTVYKGVVQDNSSGVRVGGWTKNEIRRSAFTQVLSLMVSVLLSKLCYDRQGRRYLWVMHCRIKPIFRKLDSVKERQRRSGAHWSMWVMFVVGLVYNCVWTFTDLSDDEAVGITILYWLFVIIQLATMVVYFRLFGSWECFHMLRLSLQVWQIVTLLVVYNVVSMAFSEREKVMQTIPSAILFFSEMSTILLLDACDSSKLESAVALASLSAAFVTALILHMSVYQDQVVYQGFRLQSWPERIWIGQWTKGEILRTCCLTIIMLLLVSLGAKWRDRKHEKMYFVKRAKTKPVVLAELRRKIGTWIRSVVRTTVFLKHITPPSPDSGRQRSGTMLLAMAQVLDSGLPEPPPSHDLAEVADVAAAPAIAEDQAPPELTPAMMQQFVTNQMEMNSIADGHWY